MYQSSHQSSVSTSTISRLALIINQHLHLIMLGCLFIANLFIFWPGQMTGDSHAQYESAITGVYSDVHPPAMALLWRFLNGIYPGSGLLLLVHLLLLYGAAALFMAATSNPIAKTFGLLLPLIPPVSFYSSMIWKDVGFTFSYLFVFGLLSLLIMQQKRFNFFILMPLLTILFYGTAVKYQAQFIAPIALAGVAYWINKCRFNWAWLAYTMCFSASFLWLLSSFNNFFVPVDKKSHYWQIVKLYDIVGIGMQTNQFFLPAYQETFSRFSYQTVKDKFNYERSDDLVGFTDSPLRMAVNDEERHEVLRCWYQAITAHPITYLIHRWKLFWRTISIVPLERLDTLDFSSYQGLGWFCTLKKNASAPFFSSATIKQWGITAAFSLLKFIRNFFCLIIWLPFLFLYFVISILYFNKNKAAISLLLMSCSALLFFSILFFCTLSSTIRYLYVIFCLIHASHGLAYVCWRNE